MLFAELRKEAAQREQKAERVNRNRFFVRGVSHFAAQRPVERRPRRRFVYQQNYRSLGVMHVCFAIRASMRGPISSLS